MLYGWCYVRIYLREILSFFDRFQRELEYFFVDRKNLDHFGGELVGRLLSCAIKILRRAVRDDSLPQVQRSEQAESRQT